MTSAVVSTPAAQGRFFIFDDDIGAEVTCHPEHSGISAKRVSRGVKESLPSDDLRLAGITPASRLEIRPAPQMVSSGIVALDALTGGLPRGCLTEICGPASSGRTTVLLSALAAATRRAEFCALVDAGDALDPHSAAAAGVELKQLLWVRCGEDSPGKNNSPQRHRVTESENQGCPTLLSRSVRKRVGISPQSALNSDKARFRTSEHRLEQVLRATDLLLESGGFGLIVLDLADLPLQSARRIPLTTWFRFRRAVEHTPTILLAIEQQPIAGSCSSLLLQLGAGRNQYPVLSTQRADAPRPSYAHLLTSLEVTAELVRSRLERKPARSVMFETRTAWAG